MNRIFLENITLAQKSRIPRIFWNKNSHCRVRKARPGPALKPGKSSK